MDVPSMIIVTELFVGAVMIFIIFSTTAINFVSPKVFSSQTESSGNEGALIELINARTRLEQLNETVKQRTAELMEAQAVIPKLSMDLFTLDQIIAELEEVIRKTNEVIGGFVDPGENEYVDVIDALGLSTVSYKVLRDISLLTKALVTITGIATYKTVVPPPP